MRKELIEAQQALVKANLAVSRLAIHYQPLNEQRQVAAEYEAWAIKAKKAGDEKAAAVLWQVVSQAKSSLWV